MLLKFFLNDNTTSYLRDLEDEFNESSNAIRYELNRFADGHLLTSKMQGNKKVYKANKKHPLFNDIHLLMLKHTGLDQIIVRVIEKLGGLEKVFLTGNFARGLDSRIIEIIMIGEEIDHAYLQHMVEKTESLVNRKIKYVLLNFSQENIYMNDHPGAFLLWEAK